MYRKLVLYEYLCDKCFDIVLFARQKIYSSYYVFLLILTLKGYVLYFVIKRAIYDNF